MNQKENLPPLTMFVRSSDYITCKEYLIDWKDKKTGQVYKDALVVEELCKGYCKGKTWEDEVEVFYIDKSVTWEDDEGDVHEHVENQIQVSEAEALSFVKEVNKSDVKTRHVELEKFFSKKAISANKESENENYKTTPKMRL